jgi:hypothetical protein
VDAAVSLTITDTPPTGVTVLFFQLGITGATLTTSTGQNISPLNGTLPIPVNVTQLQTDSALLGSTDTLVGFLDNPGSLDTFIGLTVTLSNPQLTIYNGSGAAIGSCPNNAVCQLTPSATPLSLTFSAAPFPITWSSSSSLAFQLDVNLNTIIQPDLTVNLAAPNGVTLSQLPLSSSGAPISTLSNLIGAIQSADIGDGTDGLTLQTGDGRSLYIEVDSSTTYNFPSSVCAADNFSCLAAGQIVKVEMSLQTNSNLVASAVSYIQPAGQTVVVGNIIQLSSSGGNTMMDLILQQGPPAPATATALPPFGQRVTVTVPTTGVNYAIDSDSFTLPNGLTFASIANLMVGQEVSVAVVPGSLTTTGGSTSSGAIGGPVAATFTASSITLEPSQITGSVNSALPINVSGLSFVLSTYPNYFVPPSATAATPPTPMPVNLTVQATSATTFTNLTPDSISGLAAGDVVSVKGWLFPYGAIPLDCLGVDGCAPFGVIAAETVVGRPGPTPLF